MLIVGWGWADDTFNKVGLEALDKFALAFLMNMTISLLLMYQVFQSLTLANANCDFATLAQRMGTLVKQL